MNINWAAVRKEYETTDITLAELAAKYEIKYSTIKSRKQRQGWNKDASLKDAGASSKDASKKIKKDAEKLNTESDNDAPDLNEKQVLFCLYFLKSRNQTMAAIQAGYSKKTAHVAGSRLLKNVKVRAYLNRLRQEMRSELFLEAADVIQEYMKIAFFDLTDFTEFGQKAVPVGINKDGELITKKVDYVRTRNSDEVDGTLIKEIKQSDSGITIKFYDKMKALEKLEKYLDLLPDYHQRMIQEEKLKLDRERLEHTKKMDELKNF